MKNLTVLTAINLGFDFSKFEDETFDEIQREIFEFLSDNSSKLEKEYDEVEVNVNGHRQYVNHGDFSSSGDIVDWSYYWGKPKQKVFHSEYMLIKDDGTPISMNLWCWSCDEEDEND